MPTVGFDLDEGYFLIILTSILKLIKFRVYLVYFNNFKN